LYRAPPSLTAALALGCLIEQTQPHVGGKVRWLRATRQNSQRIAGFLPVDVVSRPNSEPIRQRLGQGHLQFTRDLGHNPYFSKDKFLVKSLAVLLGPTLAHRD
jgi:hypothetical protein